MELSTTFILLYLPCVLFSIYVLAYVMCTYKTSSCIFLHYESLQIYTDYLQALRKSVYKSNSMKPHKEFFHNYILMLFSNANIFKCIFKLQNIFVDLNNCFKDSDNNGQNHSKIINAKIL